MRRVLASMLAVTILVVMGGSPAQASPWVNARWTLGGSGDEQSRLVDVSMSPNGTVVEAHIITLLPSGNRAVAMSIRPPGGPPGAEVTLPAGGVPGPITWLSSAVDNLGYGAVAWDDGGQTLELAVRAPGGDFAIVAGPDQFPGRYVTPAVGLAADGTATVAFGVYRATGPIETVGLVARRSPGGTWSTPQHLESSMIPAGDDTYVCDFGLAVAPNGHAAIAFVHRPLAGGGAFDATVGERAGATDSFTLHAVSSSNGYAAPSAAVSSAGAGVGAWRLGDQVEFVRVPVPTSTASASPIDSPGADAVATGPQTTMGASGEALVVWSSTDFQAYWSRIDSLGTASSPLELTFNAGTILAPDVAADPKGRAFAVARDGSSHLVVFRRSPGKAFGKGTDLGSSDEQPDTQRVAVDNAGDGVILWSEVPVPITTLTYSPRIRGYDGAAPHIASMTWPKTLVKGKKGSFSAGAKDVWGPVTVRWEFGDGATAAGPSVTHAYQTSGWFHATVKVRDATGLTTNRTVSVHVTPT
ncbi:MAG TPA: PKD domain-containing protein [Actinomycetota bacterium]|nr:PKD domain-containing protein [Actinomycetota bacterium]